MRWTATSNLVTPRTNKKICAQILTWRTGFFLFPFEFAKCTREANRPFDFASDQHLPSWYPGNLKINIFHQNNQIKIFFLNSHLIYSNSARLCRESSPVSRKYHQSNSSWDNSFLNSFFIIFSDLSFKNKQTKKSR